MGMSSSEQEVKQPYFAALACSASGSSSISFLPRFFIISLTALTWDSILVEY